jgi:hypothetical protein
MQTRSLVTDSLTAEWRNNLASVLQAPTPTSAAQLHPFFFRVFCELLRLLRLQFGLSFSAAMRKPASAVTS